MDSKWKLKRDDPVSANNTVQMWRLNYCDNTKTSKKKIIYNILSFFYAIILDTSQTSCCHWICLLSSVAHSLLCLFCALSSKQLPITCWFQGAGCYVLAHMTAVFSVEEKWYSVQYIPRWILNVGKHKSLSFPSFFSSISCQEKS